MGGAGRCADGVMEVCRNMCRRCVGFGSVREGVREVCERLADGQREVS